MSTATDVTLQHTGAIPVPPLPARATTVYPETIRLPKTGTTCPWTGLSRSAMNQLVLPCRQNNFRPPVRSYCLRQRGSKTGIRLVSFDSLINYILQHEQQPGQPEVEEETTTEE
jgi:hypothetical protein